jgi:uncharacterized protein (UPF0332 family)
MKGSKIDLINHRIVRAKETLNDARLLAENGRWNSSINRLYYAAYYAVTALLLKSDLKPSTHNGVKSNFSEHFILTNIIPKEFGRVYSQLFSWRQKGDYDDLYDFDSEKVMPYFHPVIQLIALIEEIIKK